MDAWTDINGVQVPGHGLEEMVGRLVPSFDAIHMHL